MEKNEYGKMAIFSNYSLKKKNNFNAKSKGKKSIFLAISPYINTKNKKVIIGIAPKILVKLTQQWEKADENLIYKF